MKHAYYKILFFVFNFTFGTTGAEVEESFTFTNPVRFPYSPNQGPFVGMVAAIALVLEPPYKDVSIAFNFEANYDLPSNQSELTYPPLIGRSLFHRDTFYKLLELKLQNEGFEGEGCLLRTVCEASVYSPKFTGVIGDIFDILLRPTSSVDTIDSKYISAEKYGKKKKHCKKYESKCSVSLLNLISVVENLL